jgi:hypothetical protein
VRQALSIALRSGRRRPAIQTEGGRRQHGEAQHSSESHAGGSTYNGEALVLIRHPKECAVEVGHGRCQLRPVHQALKQHKEAGAAACTHAARQCGAQQRARESLWRAAQCAAKANGLRKRHVQACKGVSSTRELQEFF